MKYTETLMYKEIVEQKRAIMDCDAYNAETLAELGRVINEYNPTSVILAARGTSDHAGIYFKYLVETIWGLPVSLAAPSVLTLYNGKLNLKGTLVVGVSQSGMAADANEIIRRANRDGAITVGITNNIESLIAKEAKYHLYCNAGEEVSVAATKTFTTECYLLAKLVETVTKDEELTASLAKVTDIIDYSLSLEEVIVKASILYKDSKDCFVLGRGMLYGATLETALKMQETTYIRAKAFAISDFVHGPFAQIDEGTKVVCLCCDDNVVGDCSHILGRLNEVGADVTLITNSDKLSANVNIRFSPLADKYNAVYAIAPIVQLFACSLSVARGLTPDAPRGLKKVTVTK